MDENTPGERPSLSLAEAAEKLRQSRIPKEEAQAEPEDQAEVTEEAETEDAEAEPEEVEPDQSEEEAEEQSGEDDEDALYEVEGETFTLSELREWKKSGLRQQDYTKKTQEVAELRKSLDAERQSFDAERQKIVSHFKERETQLKEALATFAVQQEPKPERSKYRTLDDYILATEKWEQTQAKKQEARQVYQALQAREQEEIVKRETAELLRHFPDWRDPQAFQAAADRMVELGGNYGFSAQEMAAITDHRMFRVLKDLMDFKSQTSLSEATAKAAAKKVVKAAKRLPAGAKPDSKNQTSKELRSTRDRLKKTGSMQDAVALLRARRSLA